MAEKEPLKAFEQSVLEEVAPEKRGTAEALIRGIGDVRRAVEELNETTKDAGLETREAVRRKIAEQLEILASRLAENEAGFEKTKAQTLQALRGIPDCPELEGKIRQSLSARLKNLAVRLFGKKENPQSAARELVVIQTEIAAQNAKEQAETPLGEALAGGMHMQASGAQAMRAFNVKPE